MAKTTLQFPVKTMPFDNIVCEELGIKFPDIYSLEQRVDPLMISQYDCESGTRLSF